VRRPVWSTDSALVFEGGRFPLRWLASRKKKKVAAWNSGGAWTVRYVDGEKPVWTAYFKFHFVVFICIPASAPCVESSECVFKAAHEGGIHWE